MREIRAIHPKSVVPIRTGERKDRHLGGRLDAWNRANAIEYFPVERNGAAWWRTEARQIHVHDQHSTCLKAGVDRFEIPQASHEKERAR